MKQQLDQLEQGLHPDYLRKLKKLETVYKDRLLLNEVWREYEVQRAEEDYVLEKQLAARELEEKKVELQENLISELEEKKRVVESERLTMELTGDSMEVRFYFQIYLYVIFGLFNVTLNLNIKTSGKTSHNTQATAASQ